MARVHAHQDGLVLTVRGAAALVIMGCCALLNASVVLMGQMLRHHVIPGQACVTANLDIRVTGVRSNAPRVTLVKTAASAATVRTAMRAALQMDLALANLVSMVQLAICHAPRIAMVSTVMAPASVWCPTPYHVTGSMEHAPAQMDSRVSTARVSVPRDCTGVTVPKSAPAKTVLLVIT